jgi:hypothetical protein
VYKQYIKVMFSVIIPLLVLLVLNVRIFLAMRKSRLRYLHDCAVKWGNLVMLSFLQHDCTDNNSRTKKGPL